MVYSHFDTYGSALAIDGDTVVVGAPRGGGLDPAGLGLQLPGGSGGPLASPHELVAGVFVFERQGVEWSETARFAARDPDEYGFGRDVALSGETFVVGQYPQSAYVYEREAGQWALAQRVWPGVTPPSFPFAREVDLDGDVLVVSGKGSPSLPGGGTVGVWRRTPGGWEPAAWYQPDEPPGFFSFAERLELSGTRVVSNLSDTFQGGAAWVHRIDGL